MEVQMKRSNRFLVVAILVLLVSALMVTSVFAARDPFIDVWESIDIDGSYQVMRIGGGPGDNHRVFYYDFGASICDDPPFSGALEYAALARGWLTHTGNTLSGNLSVYCRTRPPTFWGDAAFDLVYDPSTDTFTDGLGIVWNRR
jgi:hypothetical protein